MPEVVLTGAAGRIEGRYTQGKGETAPVALILHPHPKAGGQMNNPVTVQLFHLFMKRGFSVLRFNFRGVGKSEGAHDEGRGEQGDAAAAVDEMARRFPGLPIVLGGFSFGSSMAVRVGCADARVRALLVMGFPEAMLKDTSFLASCTQPRLFVQGENDAFADGPRIRALVATLPEPKTLVVIPGSDHFFAGHLDELQAAVSSWAATRPWAAA